MSRAAKGWALAGTGALVAAVAAACFSDRTGGITGLPQDCRDLATAAGVPAGNIVIGIKDFLFVPANVEVSRGATVTWVNCETAPSLAHTATADDRSWTSPFFNRGQVYSRTFTTAGTIPYHCDPHPNMVATLVVK